MNPEEKATDISKVKRSLSNLSSFFFLFSFDGFELLII